MAASEIELTKENNSSTSSIKNELIYLPPEILFPSELNQHLKQEIHFLTQENCLLKKNVHELEDEVKKKQTTITNLIDTQKKSSENEFVTPNEATRSKIVELSKKLREKAAENTHFKNKCAKLEQTIAVMKQNEKDLAESSIVIEEKPVEKPPESELKILNDKISNLNSKLFDEKNLVLQLKNEMKLAVKVLQEEIGESFENIQQISNNLHWKGRAQIINELQFKLSEHKDKLKTYQDKGNSCELATRKSYLEKKLDKLTKDNQSLKSDLEVATRKLENGRTKIKSLDSECHTWRTKYATIAEQFEKDRAISMHREEPKVVNQHEEILKKKEKTIEKLQKENKTLKFSLKKTECDVDNLKKTISEKQEEINNLNTNARKSPVKSPESNFKNLNQSQLVAERMRLLELTKVYSERLQSERDEKTNYEILLKSERRKSVKLENQLARSRLDDSEKSSYSSLLSRFTSDESTEYKLEIAEEKIKALQTRLTIEKNERNADLHEFSRVLQTGGQNTH